MAIIKNYEDHSTIQVRNDVHFVFGSLSYQGKDLEKMKRAIDKFKAYFETIEEEVPVINMSWKNAQEGQWTLSDDFRIIQILKRTESKHENSYNKAIIRTCVGTFAINDGTVFDTDFDNHPDRYRVSNKVIDHHVKIVERKEMTAPEGMFASSIARGVDSTKAYMRFFPTENEKYAKDMSRFLMKQERIKRSVSDEMESLMNETGVTKEYILESYKTLIDDGLMKLKDCAPAVRSALKDMAEMQSMMPDKTKQSAQGNGVFDEIDDDYINRIEAAEQRSLNGKQENLDDFEQEYISVENVTETDESFVKKIGMDLLS